MLRTRDLRVVTLHTCLRPPNHILMLRKLPFLLLVCCFMVVNSIGMCLKSFVIVPLGPLTVTFLVFTVRVTAAYELAGRCPLTFFRNTYPFFYE